MQYALVDGARQEAFPKGKGVCPTCGADMIAKCGSRIMRHWAHAHAQNCDPWWENETQWHREWKSHFPPEHREVSHTADDGEIHRADVKTPTGIVIEFQHSTMTDQERLSREKFYQNLVWVVDGRGFKRNFDIFHELPDPDSEVALDIVWIKATRQGQGAAGGYFWRRSENPQVVAGDRDAMVQIHGISKIQDAVDTSYRGHHQYHWIKPHRTWLDATCPVYIDFGDEYLVRLEQYGIQKMPCVKYVTKRKFLHDALVQNCAQSIATEFYPIAR